MFIVTDQDSDPWGRSTKDCHIVNVFASLLIVAKRPRAKELQPREPPLPVAKVGEPLSVRRLTQATNTILGDSHDTMAHPDEMFSTALA